MTSIRDKDLLDALERLEQERFSGTAWRSIRQGRDPLQCWRAGGRWDDRSFDVLYCSLDRQGAIEERRFHLFKGQPLPPSRISHELFELTVSLSAAIRFESLTALESVGLEVARYGALSYADSSSEYPTSQKIAEACFFLGADGIVVPNARHDSLNVIVFCDQDPAPQVSVLQSHGVIEWDRGSVA